jgi:hypothetical protein
MSRKSLGTKISCDVCGLEYIKITLPVKTNLNYCSISLQERGLLVSVDGFGYGGNIDICIDCKIEALRKSINTYEQMSR